MTNRRILVAVVGEARADERSEQYRLAQRLGKALVDHGYRIIHGGRGGVMRAVAQGAKQSDHYGEGRVIGILPGFDADETNAYTDVALPTGLDTYRNLIVANAAAVVAVGGGAGTLSEMALAWVLRRMVIGYDVAGWSGKLAGQRIDDHPRVAWEGDQVFKVTNEDQVIALLKEYLPHYSARYPGLMDQERPL